MKRIFKLSYTAAVVQFLLDKINALPSDEELNEALNTKQDLLDFATSEDIESVFS